MEGVQQPAGWYDDPEVPGQLRYWDGAQWTDNRYPKGGVAPAPGLAGPPPVGPPPAAPPPVGPPPVGVGYAPVATAQQQTNGKAVAALVLGLVAFFIPLLGVLAVIFGFIGRSEAAKNPHQSGEGMAVAGIVCGIAIGLLGFFFWYSVYSP